MAAKCTTASGGLGGRPSLKPAKVGWVVSALNAWPLSVRSAIKVGTPGRSSGFRSALRTEWPWATRCETAWRPALPVPPVNTMRLPDMDFDPRDYRAAFLKPASEVVDRRRRGFRRADGRSDKPRAGARYRPPYRLASSTAKRGRASPGWFSSRLREPEDGWRTNGGARVASRFQAGR